MRRGVIFSLVLAGVSVSMAAAAWRHAHLVKNVPAKSSATVTSEEPKPPVSSSTDSNTSTTDSSTNSTNSSSSSVSSNSTNINGVETVNLSVTANDYSASQTSFTIDKGAKVTMTFGLSGDVYDGGLVFRSTGITPAINTAVVKPNQPQSVSFVATQSFAFIPYWPTDNTKKNYQITITVK